MQTILTHIADWLRQNSSLIITGLIAFASSIITSVLLAPFVGQRIRRGAEKRDEHLAELKRGILQPMLDYLREHVLPILELRCGNVGMRRRSMHRPSARLMEDSTTFVDELCLMEAAEPPINLLLYPDEGDPATPPSEGPLYDDARLQHFPNCFRAWDGLLAALDNYNADCMSYVEELRQEIAQSCSLPEYDGSLRQSEWVNAISLALVVFYRQIGLPGSQFSRAPESNAERLVYNSMGLVQGPPNQIDRCVLKLDELLARRDAIEKIVSEASRAKQDALEMQAEIERLLLTRRLPGRCSFLA